MDELRRQLRFVLYAMLPWAALKTKSSCIPWDVMYARMQALMTAALFQWRHAATAAARDAARNAARQALQQGDEAQVCGIILYGSMRFSHVS